MLLIALKKGITTFSTISVLCSGHHYYGVGISSVSSCLRHEILASRRNGTYKLCGLKNPLNFLNLVVRLTSKKKFRMISFMRSLHLNFVEIQHRNESNVQSFHDLIIVEFDVDVDVRFELQNIFQFFRIVTMIIWEFSDTNRIEKSRTDENRV